MRHGVDELAVAILLRLPVGDDRGAVHGRETGQRIDGTPDVLAPLLARSMRRLDEVRQLREGR